MRWNKVLNAPRTYIYKNKILEKIKTKHHIDHTVIKTMTRGEKVRPFPQSILGRSSRASYPKTGTLDLGQA